MSISLKDVAKPVLQAEYAVRGPIVAKAQELERQGKEIIYCNIGNPQALGQPPIAYQRQMLALCEYPELLETAKDLFPADVIERAGRILKESKHGLGAYSDSKGLKYIREAIASFIKKRDGIESDPEKIYLTDGASKGVQTTLRIIAASPQTGIMIPMPQYPLYSATIVMYGAKQVHYYLDEAHDWKLSRELLEDAIAEAKQYDVDVKAICVINPGNPTGSVLDAENIAMVIDFAQTHGLSILADEVYQQNIYKPGDSFVSFAKVMHEMGERDVSLFSFHSCSKGFLGECGHRGGYFEVRNVGDDVLAEITKLQSISLCSNLPGQVMTYCLVRPPEPGEPSYARFAKERDDILESLKKRALLLAQGLNEIPGIQCNAVAGAMYAFPKIMLPPGRTDADYCLALLEKTGICVVPGSGFGQIPGTAHFRTTILPPEKQLEKMIGLLAEFQASYT